MLPAIPNAAPRCTAFDSTRAQIAQAIQDRINSINELSQQTIDGLNLLNSNVTAAEIRLRNDIQVEAARLTSVASQLDQTNLNLVTTDQNLANTNRNLASTDQALLQMQGQLATNTNQLNSRIETLDGQLIQSRNELNNQQNQLVTLQNQIEQVLLDANSLQQGQANQGNAISLLESTIRIPITEILVAQDSVNRQLMDIQIARSRIDQIAIDIGYLEWTMNTTNMCPLGRNQYGNCNEPAPTAPTPACTQYCDTSDGGGN
jgi:chromosome segregation ATPase